MFKKAKNQKGFTLIELIVVIAILGILAAIAIPRFTSIQDESKVKADASTATQIINAARIQETNTGKKVEGLNQADDAKETDLQKTYFAVPASAQTGGLFSLTGGGDKPYTVEFTPTSGIYENVTFQVIEGTPFDIATSRK